MIFHCSQCKAAISNDVQELENQALVCEEDQKDLIPAGAYSLSKTFMTSGHTYVFPPDEVILNLSDLKNTVPGGTRNGCCGTDGLDGINVFCSSGHPLGTEMSDCWMAKCIHLPLKNLHCLDT